MFATSVLTLAGLLCGCQHLKNAPQPAPANRDAARLQLRNNAASLLHDLLGDEKNVGKVFIVKNGREIEPLVKLIASAADTNEKRLEQMAQEDPALNITALELPPGEKAARDAIAKSKEHDLLFSSGVNFEFNLLLTQAEAQNYGWHLAKVAGGNSPTPAEARVFATIGETMEHLYEQTVAEMRSLPKPAKAAP
ncbi:MAG: hypothetical protein ABSH48_04680 [Verrucomicrobiota bacterium]